MNRLLVLLIASVFLPTVQSAASTVDWCYHSPTCNDTTWPVIATQFCNGSRQSPINIVSASAQADSSLTNFTFTRFGDRASVVKIQNTGRTVKVELASGVQVSGGGLSETYDSLQFHLHWGNRVAVPGSEHTVNGKRYPMEMHIVNIKSSLNGNTTLAVQDSTGLAALGFFIEAASGNATGSPASWRTLTSFLTNITSRDQYADITGLVSLDDLLGDVDRTKYYRYLGSLTTPNCNEAVLWTVFKESIKVSQDLIDLFSTTVRINTTSSLLMTNVYRNIQPDNGRQVTTNSSPPSLAGAYRTWVSLGLVSLSGFLMRR